MAISVHGGEGTRIPQERRYNSNAQRQAAYRARLADRRALVGTDAAVERLRDLELALAHAQRRAASAEARADHADERRRRSDTTRGEAEARRYQRASQVDAGLQAALERIVDLEFLVDELSRRLAAAEERSPIEPPQQFGPSSSQTLAAPNRAQRRRSERKKRRGQ